MKQISADCIPGISASDWDYLHFPGLLQGGLCDNFCASWPTGGDAYLFEAEGMVFTTEAIEFVKSSEKRLRAIASK